MKIAVRYYSKSGNTKKLAEAIAQAAGVTAQTVSTPLTEDVDILFLGSAVYAAGIDQTVRNFIENIDVKIGMVYNFSTAAVLKSTHNQVARLLAEKHIPFAADEFYCRGAFGPLHKGRPNKQDIANAKEFAIKILKENNE